ncbi:MAG: AMP-binding protein, partial [Alphaproteobacteria bacterium]|nr:AMP-binding protein [Alphaproteobacteria bacterium]
MTAVDTRASASGWPWLAHYPAGVDWHAAIDKGPVHEMLERTVAAHAARPAVDFMGHVVSWGEFGQQVNRLAQGLQTLGVKKGTRVGLFLPNCTYFLMAYYAILKAGGTVVNFNPLYAPRELVHQIQDSQTEIMLTLDLKILYDKLSDIRQESGLARIVVCPFADILPFPKSILFPLLKRRDVATIPDESYISWLQDIMENEGTPAAVRIQPEEDIAVLQYTGGTTGVPKGAMLTHANVSANTHQCALWFLGAKPGEKMLGVIPFFHVFAMTAVMNLSVRLGFEIVIPVPRFDLDKTLQAIHKKKPNYFPAVPAIYNAINNHPKLAQYNLRSLRFCMSGGAPLPVEVKKSFETNTGCVVVEGYGLTETTPVVCVNPVVGENKAGSIGMPLPGTIVEIINPEDKTTVMAAGERGELCVRGPQVMKGYWNKLEETNNVMHQGRLHTGDIALMDE